MVESEEHHSFFPTYNTTAQNFPNSNSNEQNPVKQGMWGIFEVFASMIVSTLTALVVLITKSNKNALFSFFYSPFCLALQMLCHLLKILKLIIMRKTFSA